MAEILDMSKAKLQEIDLEDAHQRQLLHDQRIICGWGANNMETWRKYIANGQRTMFWIAVPPPATITTTTTTTNDDQAAVTVSDRSTGLDYINAAHRLLGDEGGLLAAGHIALDGTDVPSKDVPSADETLTAPDGSRLTVTSLFVLPAYRRLRLGEWAMLALEAVVRDWPRYAACTALTLNTLAPRHFPGGLEGRAGTGMWALIGEPMPPRSQAGFYEKLGYVVYKEGVRYSAPAVDGGKVDMYGVFMEKCLDKPQGQAGEL